MDTELGNIEILETHRGHGMSILLAHQLLREVMKHPGRKVYTNFELPKALKKTVEKYATIEKVDAKPAR